jgi:hypothetical protein
VLNELPRDNGWVFGLRRRTVPFTPQTPAYKGEQWLALSSGAVAAALDSPHARSWQDWYRTTLIPDESYFPTVLADAHGLRIDPTGITWHRWRTDVSRLHPIDVTRELLDEVARSRKPFARKFDESANPGVLDAVDRLLLGDALADEAT